MKPSYYSNERSVQIILALLKTHGIRKVIASPGATNLSLVASMQQDDFFEMYSSVDERSAAYMACGMAEESGEPVVITCTGATASRNYLPGLTEAYYRKLPVLAITANQGLEKVGHLIAQNIDRSTVQNDIAMESVSIPACSGIESERNCEYMVNKAILALFRYGGGPAHINYSTTFSPDYNVQELPPARAIYRISPGQIRPELPKGRIAFYVGAHKPFTQRETALMDAFCATYDAVVFCDHTSGYYGKYRVQAALISAQEQAIDEALNTKLLLHIGEISGDYYSLKIFNKTCETWRISDDGEIRDISKRLTHVFEMSLEDFLLPYSENEGKKDNYLRECQTLINKHHSLIPELPFSNIWIAKYLSGKMPHNSVVHLGILNSLRSWNFFELPTGVRTNCNVGGFGIDGSLSSLVGASLVNPNKLYYVILGDLAFFYDMNALGNRHIGKNIRILLINNARGTEFRNYKHRGAAFGEAADPYIAAAGHYGNASPVLVKHFAEDLGFEYLRANSKSTLAEVADKFTDSRITAKPMILEAFTSTQDESDALEIMLNLIQSSTSQVQTSTSLVSKTKGLAKMVLGESSVASLKKILKK